MCVDTRRQRYSGHRYVSFDLYGVLNICIYHLHLVGFPLQNPAFWLLFTKWKIWPQWPVSHAGANVPIQMGLVKLAGEGCLPPLPDLWFPACFFHFKQPPDPPMNLWVCNPDRARVLRCMYQYTRVCRRISIDSFFHWGMCSSISGKCLFFLIP